LSGWRSPDGRDHTAAGWHVSQHGQQHPDCQLAPAIAKPWQASWWLLTASGPVRESFHSACQGTGPAGTSGKM